MVIKRINEFPEGSGSLTSDDIFLFMDDPSGSGITKKVSLTELSNAIGGGGGNPFDQNLNTTDFPTFSGVNLSNNSSLSQGSFDTNNGGNYGISLNCVVGYELNWQAGHLRNVVAGDATGTAQPIYIDSDIQFPGSGISYMAVDSSGITFPDGTSQNSANISSTNITNFDSAVSGLLPIVANSGDNRLLTSTGSTIGVNAESNATFDGTTLSVSGVFVATSGSFTQRLDAPLSYFTVSPAVSGTVNDWDPGSVADVIRTSGTARINGLVNTYSADVVLLYNVGTSGNITLTHASGTANNQFLVPWLGDYILSPNGGAALIVRDKVDNKWRIT